MRIEHLVASMNKNGENLYEDMNLACDTIIANQTKNEGYVVIDKNGKKLKILSTNTKGVGTNRNLGLALASADFCILSDDDMRYRDNYIKEITGAFERLKKADIIIFNIETIGGGMTKRRANSRIKRVRWFNFMNYGAARIVFRREAVIRQNIWFNELFGGGAKYSSGEDTLFLADALKRGLKIYAFPAEIATVNQKSSTWFNGYDEKFFYDKGALAGKIFPRLGCLFLFLYFSYRFKSEINFRVKIKCLKAGMKGYDSGMNYAMWRKNVQKSS